MNTWCTIESDPAVFEEMIHRFGAENVFVSELLDLDYDEHAFKAMGKIYGFVFLFKWVPNANKTPKSFFNDPDVFFAKQVVQNACATQAILAIMFNNLPKIKLNEELTNLAGFSEGLDPTSRGLAIGECQGIRDVHNSFVKQDSLQVISGKHGEKEDAYHFVGYIFKKGKVLELDGLQEAPILLPSEGATEENWPKFVLEEVRSRAQTYTDQEIRFTLLAISESQEQTLKSQLEEVKKQLSSDNVSAEDKIKLHDELLIVESRLEDAARVKQQRKEENERRKHDYLPLIFALLEATAKSGQLESLLDAAEEKFKPKPQ